MTDEDKLNFMEDHIDGVINKYKVQLENMKNSWKPSANENQTSTIRNASISLNRNDHTSSRSNELKESENRSSGRFDSKQSKLLNINLADVEIRNSTNFHSKNQTALVSGSNEENRQAYSSLIMKDDKDKYL